jgi:hypothetical protein
MAEVELIGAPFDGYGAGHQAKQCFNASGSPLSAVCAAWRGRPSGLVVVGMPSSHRDLAPTRSALAGTDRGAEVAAVGSAYASAKPCRQLG